MQHAPKVKEPVKSRSQAGFTMLETMVAMVILLAVGSIVMSGAVQMMKTQGTIANRTEMHTSVRSVTELLEQEIGQAGRVSPPLNAAGTAPANLTLLTPVVGASPDLPITLPVAINPDAAVAGLFNNEWLVVDAGQDITGAPKQESVQITCGNPCANPVTATFSLPHNPLAAPVPVSVQGSFSAGVLPPTGIPAAGSSGNVLKMFGDINGDGTMVYLEYTCAPNAANPAQGFLYRNEMPWSAAAKPPLDNTMILLGNLLPNPNDQNGNPVPCFQYQTKTIAGVTFVTDVEVTLTVQTQYQDPQTGLYQRETKALLNVSPRNIFNAWEAYAAEFFDRVQPTPPSITPLIP